MKKIIGLPALLFAAFVFNACNPADSATTQPLHIHLQGGFDHNYVKIDIDGNTVFEDTVTTNNVLGLAHSFDIEKNHGTHQVGINVNNMASAIDTFDLHSELWLGITYFDFTDNITIEYSNIPYMYE